MISMIKRILLSLLLLISFVNVNSQDFMPGIRSGIGTYTMKDLKTLNNRISGSLPFDCKLVADFPPYFYYSPTILLGFHNFRVGLIYSFQSTGSRISAKDYSGEYLFDMKIKSGNPGIYIEYKLSSQGKFDIFLYSLAGPSFSKLEIRELFTVSDTTLANHDYKFKAQNYFIEPGVNFQVPVQAFTFRIDLGYLLQFGKKPLTGQNKSDMLYDPVKQVPVKCDWTGFRAGLSVFFSF